ncbi:hypothetical protein FNF27_07870 [Cafeteria roenbergensis]|uniref:EF-hand domain-containing protein n=1 Tax=Cafeteria roenbergensis TaxID=33653 RepID=A0A5A8D1U6_CAFRO|nr:hypothetical protein FNF29_02498 [Cafeteria roenbergensis]KAA0158340.1 hypothetical protein FNF28_06249 [Cafeteria roenbergensis]KAA0159073.1 hypothetical protein FNF31_05025 [Cafeteria roenbergensis]KAA0163912.1 hypothetical protein FNF27_07870 [Cafeteria roenbergensis]|mmetsp:Transcript_6846/g.28018  ORF Transcript_6846/g.28018 Transcript_6846/m.28018 type:complete len:189 (-) Transcript_6846:462-1028(-)|eukprot:KAA0154278.1 hypothetical protein FNF29_02498 [Cafeteria roenbergensis]
MADAGADPPAVPMPAAATARKKKTRNIAAAKVVEEHRALLDGLTVPQIAALQSTFLSFSTEVPGFINAKQLGPLLRELGDDPSAEELGELISLVDASGNGLVDLEEFSALLAIRTQHKHTPSDVREALKLFDVKGTGKIPRERFATLLCDLAGMSVEDAEEAVAVATAGQEDGSEVDAAAFIDLLFRI